MAETAPAKKPEPKKPLGRPKKGPLEMAEFFYSRKAVHIWIFATSLILTGSCVAMIVQDWDREWKDYQIEFSEIEHERAVLELETIRKEMADSGERLKKLQADRDRASAAARESAARFDAEALEGLAAEAKELRAAAPQQDPDVRADIEEVLGDVEPILRGLGEPRKPPEFELYLQRTDATYLKAKQRQEFADAEQKVAKYTVEHKNLLYKLARSNASPDLAARERDRDHAEREFEKVNTRLDFAKRLFSLVEKLRQGINETVAELALAVKKTELQIAEIRAKEDVAKRKVQEFEMTVAKKIRNAPGLDFFGPSLKVLPEGGGVLDDVYEEFNFVQVPKVDRCITCHRGIDQPAAYAAARDKDGSIRFLDRTVQKIFERRYPDTSTREKMTKLFMAHPEPTLYVSGVSPHDLKRFGCSTCHQGDGRETDFSLAVHTPPADDLEDPERKEWVARNHWHHRHLWDRPMVPMRYIEASCRKCHSKEFEIDGADRYVQGMIVYERAGCYACHKTDTYPVLEKHVKELYPLPGDRGDMTWRTRRPGPPLTALDLKVDRKWAYNWILSPRSFRPTTKMPHFFGLSNARSVETFENGKPVVHPPRLVEAVQVAAIAEFLFFESITARDRPAAYPPVPATPEAPSADRGKRLADQVGCAVCHRFDEDYPHRLEGVNAYLDEFAPNLANAGNKLGREWLFAWLKDPKHYMPDARMPSLRLSDQEAADLAEYLVALKSDNRERAVRGLSEWQPAEPPLTVSGSDVQGSGPALAVLKELAFELLQGEGLIKIDAEARLSGELSVPHKRLLYVGRRLVGNFGCYSCHDIRGFGDVEGIGTELTGAQPWANKFEDRLDFGQTKFDGVNYFGTRFEDAAAGRPYVSRVTGDEHIKILHNRHQFLLNKVMQPRVYDGGLLHSKHWSELLKMPQFWLSREEAELVATFVLSFTNENFRGLLDRIQDPHDETEQVLNRGHRLIREQNCLACHRLDLDRYLVTWDREEEADGGRKSTNEWIEGNLSEVSEGVEACRDTLEAYGVPIPKDPTLYSYEWASDPRTLRRPGVLGDSRFILHDGARLWYVDDRTDPATLRPVLRHVPRRGGTALEQIRKVKEARGIADRQKLEARFPPMLRTQGLKTQVEWLIEFLKAPHQIRPNLGPIFEGAPTSPDVNVRMPTFGFDNEEATSLAKFFWTRDATPGQGVFPVSPLPMRDPGTVASARERLLQTDLPFIVKNCNECHFLNGRPPPGGDEGVHKFAPELTEVHARLRPEWLEAWLEHPGWIYPGTTMTELYREPDKRRGGVDALMNLDRFRDQLGPAPE